MFWRSPLRMQEQAFDEGSWTQIVEDLQSVRLDFINCVRREFVGLLHTIERLPIVTPPVRNSLGQGENPPPEQDPASAD